MERRGIQYSARERKMYRQARVNVGNNYLLIARYIIQHGKNDEGIDARFLEKYRAALYRMLLGRKNREHKQGWQEFKEKSDMFWQITISLYIPFLSASSLQHVYYLQYTEHTPPMTRKVLYFVILKSKGVWINVTQWPERCLKSPVIRLFVQQIWLIELTEASSYIKYLLLLTYFKHSLELQNPEFNYIVPEQGAVHGLLRHIQYAEHAEREAASPLDSCDSMSHTGAYPV